MGEENGTEERKQGPWKGESTIMEEEPLPTIITANPTPSPLRRIIYNQTPSINSNQNPLEHSKNSQTHHPTYSHEIPKRIHTKRTILRLNLINSNNPNNSQKHHTSPNTTTKNPSTFPYQTLLRSPFTPIVAS